MNTIWKTKKLYEVCDIGAGNSAPQKKELFIDGKYPFFRTSDIGKIHIGNILESLDYLNEKGIKGLKKFYKGTILLPKSGASTFLNHRVILGTDGYVSSHLATIKTDEKILNNSFLFYFLQEIKAQDLIQDHKYPSLNLPVIEGIEISFPYLSEQQRIVKILDEAFELIAKTKNIAEKNLQNSKDIFESYLQNIFENKGEGWEEKRLGDVLQKTETIDPTKKPKEEFIYLDVSSVNKETKNIENATLIMGKDAPSRARKLVRTNDVIFATVRPTHRRVALITEEYNGQVCSTGYFVLRAKEFLDNNLVLYFLLTNSFNKQMEKLQKGASYPAVTDNEVKNIIISFPKSLSEQKEIVKKLNKLSEETKKLESIYKQKLADLDELKKSIINKAFNGEL